MSHPFLPYLFAALSGCLCSIAFLNHELFVVAWFCYVPILIAIQSAKTSQIYLLGLITGITSFALTTFWVVDFIVLSKNLSQTTATFIALFYWLYSGQMIAIVLVIHRWLDKRCKVNQVILFPITYLFVATLYPSLFPHRLADSQVEFTAILQIAEFTGAWGIDALITLANITIVKAYHWMTEGRWRQEKHTSTHINRLSTTFLGLLLISVSYGYGLVSLQEWRDRISHWPTETIGIVQPNETPSLQAQDIFPGYMRGYSQDMAMTEQLAEKGAQVVIWPEGRYKGILNQDRLKNALEKHVKELDISLVFQDIDIQKDAAQNQESKYNSAVHINAHGQFSETYQKRKLIPFGESLTFFEGSEFIRSKAESFLGEFLNEMQAGHSPILFKTEMMGIIPLICYETLFPKFVANTVNSIQMKPYDRPLVIAALSNNGWFNSYHQSRLHVQPSLIRAIETRTPLIHVVNNGPSIVVSPSGDVHFISKFQQAGGYLVELSLPLKDDRVTTFYVRYPNAFLYAVQLVFVLLMIVAIRQRRTS